MVLTRFLAWWRVPLDKPIVCRKCAERRTHLNQIVVYVHRGGAPFYCPNGCSERLLPAKGLTVADVNAAFGEAS